MLMMIVLIVIDVVYLTFWTSVYPFQRAVVAIDVGISSLLYKYIPSNFICNTYTGW